MERMTLKAARVNAGYSQEKAAELLGVTCKTLCYWEMGKTFPTQPYIDRICELYSVRYDMLKFVP